MAEKPIIEGAIEALAVARGEQPAAAIWHNGHRYVSVTAILPLRAASIAAAWGTWKSRNKTPIGPGPGFVEAVEAAIKEQFREL